MVVLIFVHYYKRCTSINHTFLKILFKVGYQVIFFTWLLYLGLSLNILYIFCDHLQQSVGCMWPSTAYNIAPQYHKLFNIIYLDTLAILYILYGVQDNSSSLNEPQAS